MGIHAEPTHRFRALAMEFAAHLDEHFVELHIITDTGDSIAIACPSASIIEIQRHIDQLVRQCPEIVSWGNPKSAN